MPRITDRFKRAEMRLQFRYTLHFSIIMVSYSSSFLVLRGPEAWRVRIILLVVAFLGLTVNLAWWGICREKLKKLHGR